MFLFLFDNVSYMTLYEKYLVDSISLAFVPEQQKCIILIIVQGLVAKQLQECGRK